MRRSKIAFYSITSSARGISIGVGDTVRPNAVAVFFRFRNTNDQCIRRTREVAISRMRIQAT